MKLNIQHDKKKKIFYVKVDGKESHVEYKVVDAVTIDCFHTFVPISQRGKGIAIELVKHVFNYAHKNNLKIIPSCWFIKKFVEHNPRFKDFTVDE